MTESDGISAKEQIADKAMRNVFCLCCAFVMYFDKFITILLQAVL
jgi:hypothetical protein